MTRDTFTRILDLALWAPSGENTQPWRFEVVDDRHVRVHGFDTRDHVLYDYDGPPSHIAHCALLATMPLAASCFGLNASWPVASHGADRSPASVVVLPPYTALLTETRFACG